MVGADVLGGPRARGRPRCRPVGNGAPGTSRPTMGARMPDARMACVCGARCACADMARCVVGADVPGGPRVRGCARWRPVGNGAPRTSRPTMGVWCGTW